MTMLGGTITRLRAPLVADSYSGAATRRDWAAATSVSLAGFAVAPAGPGEAASVNRTDTTTEPTLYGPHGADVLASDRIVSGGRTWDVTGHRADWASAWSRAPFGATWPLRLVEG